MEQRKNMPGLSKFSHSLEITDNSVKNYTIVEPSREVGG